MQIGKHITGYAKNLTRLNRTLQMGEVILKFMDIQIYLWGHTRNCTVAIWVKFWQILAKSWMHCTILCNVPKEPPIYVNLKY